MFKRNLVPILILLIIFTFILQPGIVYDGAFKGLNIWIQNIVPFLFPMSVLSNILLQYNFIYSLLERFSFISTCIFKNKFAVIPYFISFIAGYPSGAIVANIMVNQKKTTQNEANYILYFTNNCSFQFIAGAVAFSMLGDFNFYKYIAVPHFLGAIILSFLFKNNENPLLSNVRMRTKPSPFNEVFSSSISKSISSMLSVGAVIVIFSIFAQFLTNIINSSKIAALLNPDYLHIIKSILIGILEMTNGCSIISASLLAPEIKLIIINFLLSFSGMSVIFQTLAVTSEINLNIGKYLISRLLFGIISSFICVLMLILL
jgi:sporulation integral membrane protein YlbJ